MATGLAINANGAVPDRAECALLGLGAGECVRTIVQGSLSLIDDMLYTLPPDVDVMVSLNNECQQVGSDWAGWDNACHSLASFAGKWPGRIKILGCANELDIYYYQGDGHVSPVFAANLVKRAAAILRPVGVKVAMSSVASGRWPEYLRTMAVACDGAADYADLHLYVKRLNGVPNNPDWQTAEAAIRQAQDLSGLPVICSEAGIKVDDAGGLEAQARWAEGLGTLPAELVCYWCWSDRMASPGETGGQAFGLRGLDGQRKPVWSAVQRVFGGPLAQPPAPTPPPPVPTPVPPPTFVLGFKAMADRHPDIIGAPRENEAGPWHNCSAQFSTKGLLLWGDFVGAGSQMGFIAQDLTRYVWDGAQLRKVA